MRKLYIIKGPSAGMSFELKDTVTLVGRAQDNDIPIDDRSVSRRHLKIALREGVFVIEDLGSQNGTWLHGKRIKPGEGVEVGAGVPVGIGSVFLSLGKRYEDPGMPTQHSIPLSEGRDRGARFPFYKDRRITNRDRLELIYEVSTLLMQSLNIDQICERILDSLFQSLKRIDSGVILLAEGEPIQLREVIARSREGRGEFRMNYSRTIVSRVIREGKAVIMSDIAQEDGAELSESIEMMRIKSIMCVPLMSERGTRGAIYVHSVKVPHGFRKDDLYLLSCLSTPAALAIENALLYTRAKHAEEAARESEEKYRLLIENAEDAILIAQDGRIRFSNRSGCRIFGHSEESLLSLDFDLLFHVSDRSNAVEWQKQVLQGNHDSGSRSLRAVSQQGETLWVQMHPVRILWEGNPATLHFIRDITLQKRFEEQALHTQKMEAVGTLAGGIAHEFNNLLMGIQGNASLMLLDTDDSHPHHKKLRNIERHVARGSELTQQLLGFAGAGQYEIQPIQMEEVVSKTAEAFARTRKGIRIHTKQETKMWRVEADRRQMEQLLLNLYINASEAMPDGGDLTITTGGVELDEQQARVAGIKPGKYVVVSVSDTGVGIDKEILGKIFEPFFTTKEIGRGVGLGLAAVYGIVKNHGGFVKVVSEKAKGTTFEVYFPALLNAETLKNAEGIRKGSRTVFLVDDEERAIEVGKNMLEAVGYRVLWALSGRDALDTYRRRMEEIDMVILDMVMPDMDGNRTYHEMKKMDPHVRVLVSSGCEIGGEATRLLANGCKGFIQKPFQMKELARKVRNVLEA